MPDSASAAANAASHLRPLLPVQPEVALILGSGLGALAEEVEDAVRVDYEHVPGFAASTVEGHAGRLVAGTLEGRRVVVFQGRFHAYEGHPAEALATPVRTASALGAGTLLVTCAAGGVNPERRAGDLMLLEDHLNLMGRNPLVGPALPGEERFPDMTEAYDRALLSLAEGVADREGVAVSRGVYAALLGPSYETPAEVRMLATLGADAVGMSTVPEVIAARAGGMRVLGIALVTNAAAGVSAHPLSHDEVVAAGAEAAGRFQRLVRGILRDLPSS
ncbi:MAG TPA: purine-nucleoside phosphorylase [Longimicrobiales bacterium]|nr:purine-nucleoside phosphorylase [Longimicrobiales bacterium]